MPKAAWWSPCAVAPVTVFDAAHAPTAAVLADLHHQAHASCFLANSVKTQIDCAPVLKRKVPDMANANRQFQVTMPPPSRRWCARSRWPRWSLRTRALHANPHPAVPRPAPGPARHAAGAMAPAPTAWPCCRSRPWPSSTGRRRTSRHRGTVQGGGRQTGAHLELRRRARPRHPARAGRRRPLCATCCTA